MLYQLSYVRLEPLNLTTEPVFQWLIGGMAEGSTSDDD